MEKKGGVEEGLVGMLDNCTELHATVGRVTCKSATAAEKTMRKGRRRNSLSSQVRLLQLDQLCSYRAPLELALSEGDRAADVVARGMEDGLGT